MLGTVNTIEQDVSHLATKIISETFNASQLLHAISQSIKITELDVYQDFLSLEYIQSLREDERFVAIEEVIEKKLQLLEQLSEIHVNTLLLEEQKSVHQETMRQLEMIMQSIAMIKTRVETIIKEIMLCAEKESEKNNKKMAELELNLHQAAEKTRQLEHENVVFTALKITNSELLDAQRLKIKAAKEVANASILFAKIFSKERHVQNYCGKKYVEMKNYYITLVYPAYNLALVQANENLKKN